MHPTLFELGPFTIRLYGVMIAVGFLSGTFLARYRAKKLGIDPLFIMDLCFYILISAMVGAKLLYIADNPSQFFTDLRGASSVTQAIEVIGGGFVFYGGLLTAIPVGLYFINRHGYGMWKIADLMAPSIALGHGLGRIGCFFAGCCHGRACPDSWYAVTFTAPDTLAPPMQPLYPTQLLSALNLFIICGILLFLAGRRHYPGQIFWVYVLIYAPNRFMIEYLRGDPRPYFFANALSLSQVISILMFVVAAGMLLYLRNRAKRAGDEV